MKAHVGHKAAAAALLAAICAAGVGFDDAGVARVSPGPAAPVGDLLAVTTPTAGDPAAGPGPLVTTVRADPLNNLEALWCHLRPGCAVMALTSTDPHAGTAQMATAVTTASTVADTLAGKLTEGPETYPDAPGTQPRVPGIQGPSAGLALALYFLDQRTPGDLFAGHRVAATGTVAPDGHVGPVGGVPYKTLGAAGADADVFLVPAAEADQVPATAGLQVVAVRDVTDAVTWLCGHGAATTSVCAHPTH